MSHVHHPAFGDDRAPSVNIKDRIVLCRQSEGSVNRASPASPVGRLSKLPSLSLSSSTLSESESDAAIVLSTPLNVHPFRVSSVYAE